MAIDRALFSNHFPWRRLGWALALSVVLHGLWLLPEVRLRPAPTVAQPLRAGFVREDVAGPSARVEKPAKAAADSLRRSAPALAAPAAATPATSELDVATHVAAHAPAQTIGTPAPDGALDGDGVRAYRLALARSARHARATLTDLPTGNGRVELRVIVDRYARRVEVGASSGQAALDAAALALMGRAVSEAPMPEVLRGQAFELAVPIEFGQPLSGS